MIHRYIVVGIIQTAGFAFILWLFSDTLGFSAFMVSLVTAPFFFFARYYANKLWVFETKKGVRKCPLEFGKKNKEHWDHYWKLRNKLERRSLR